MIPTTNFVIRIDPRLLALAKRGEDIAVLVAMLSFSDNGLGQCYASHRTIARVARVDHKTVPVSIKRMGVFEPTGEKSIRGGTVIIYEVGKQHSLYLPTPNKVGNSHPLNDESGEVKKNLLRRKWGNEGTNTIKPASSRINGKQERATSPIITAWVLKHIIPTRKNVKSPKALATYIANGLLDQIITDIPNLRKESDSATPVYVQKKMGWIKSEPNSFIPFSPEEMKLSEAERIFLALKDLDAIGERYAI